MGSCQKCPTGRFSDETGSGECAGCHTQPGTVPGERIVMLKELQVVINVQRVHLGQFLCPEMRILVANMQRDSSVMRRDARFAQFVMRENTMMLKGL